MIRKIESENQKADIFTKGLQGDFFQDWEVDVRLVRLQMRGSAAIDYIFSLKLIYYGPKGGILEYCGTFIFLYYPIISYQRIKFYGVETMDMGRSRCNNSVSGKILM